MARDTVLLTADDMRRALSRMAHEMVEHNHGAEGMVLAGMRTRGVPMAHRIAAAISSFEEVDVPVGALDINLYRDDLGRRPQPQVRPTAFPVDINGKCVVLVDDVLFTGRSTRGAMDALTDLGRPNQIQLAVLVDRGHRELPIRADYVGRNVPTAANEEIQVRMTEVDGADEVLLVANEGKVLV